MTDPNSWRNPKVLTVLLAVFAAGSATGALSYRVGRMYLRRDPSAVVQQSQPSANTTQLRDKERTLEVLKRELNLRPDQAEQVAVIIDDYKRYYVNIQDQVEEIRATGKNRILQVLDAEQRDKFTKLSETLK